MVCRGAGIAKEASLGTFGRFSSKGGFDDIVAAAEAREHIIVFAISLC